MSVSLPSINSALQLPATTSRTLAAGEDLRRKPFPELLAEKLAATANVAQDETVEEIPLEAKDEAEETPEQKKLRETFYSFVGQTFFGQLLATMRKTVGKPAYFHGGRGEEVFQAQMDQVMVERMAETTTDSFAKPMYELFTLRRE